MEQLHTVFTENTFFYFSTVLWFYQYVTQKASLQAWCQLAWGYCSDNGVHLRGGDPGPAELGHIQYFKVSEWLGITLSSKECHEKTKRWKVLYNKWRQKSWVWLRVEILWWAERNSLVILASMSCHALMGWGKYRDKFWVHEQGRPMGQGAQPEDPGNFARISESFCGFSGSRDGSLPGSEEKGGAFFHPWIKCADVVWFCRPRGWWNRFLGSYERHHDVVWLKYDNRI